MISTGAALRRGFTHGLSLRNAALAMFLARAAESFAMVLAFLGAAASSQDMDDTPTLAFASAAVVWLAGRVLSAFCDGGAVRQGAQRQADKPVEPFARAAVAASGRSLVFTLALFPVELFAEAWKWLSILAAVVGYGAALARGSHGFLASSALAILLTVGLPLSLLLTTWTRVGFVRSVQRDQGAWASLFDAAGLLAKNAWPPLLAVLLTALFATGATVALSMFASPLTPEDAPLKLELAQRLALAVLGAFATAVAELVRLQTLVAVERASELPTAPDMSGSGAPAILPHP